MRKVVVAALVALMVAFAAGCGSSSSSSSSSSGGSGSSQSQSSGQGSSHTRFAKTKFALHAGLAFGAFHRYIYKPYKNGGFSGGLRHHKVALVKAALAAAFAYHETKIALNDARSSKVLSKVLSPLLALQTKLSSLRGGLRRGNPDPSAINSANSDTSTVSSSSAASGQPIKEQAPALR